MLLRLVKGKREKGKGERGKRQYLMVLRIVV
jgi:hypothetical protein